MLCTSGGVGARRHLISTMECICAQRIAVALTLARRLADVDIAVILSTAHDVHDVNPASQRGCSLPPAAGSAAVTAVTTAAMAARDEALYVRCLSQRALENVGVEAPSLSQ